MTNYKTIRHAIEKECRRISLTDLCENWGFTTDDFDEYLDAADNALRAQQEQPNEPLTLEELREMELGQWVWIEVLQPFDCKDKVSAYYKKSYDYTGGEAICCGYPGLVFSFDYSDYGKTWLAYRRKREQEG